MNGKTRRIFLISRVVVVLAAATLLGSCGFVLSGPLAAPTGVAATTDRTDLIEVTWDAVDGANIYYVYRALSPDATFGESGPFGSVPYAAVTGTVHLDTDVDLLDYYYQVSSGRLSTNEESERSGTVRGALTAEQVEWRDTQTLSFNPGTVRTAVDRTTASARVFTLVVPDTADASLDVTEILDDGTQESLGGPDETVEGRTTGTAGIAAAGGIYAAIVDEFPLDPIDAGKPFLYRYDAGSDEEDPSWELLAGAEMSPALLSSPELTLTALDKDDLLISYRRNNGAMGLYRYNGSVTALSAPSNTVDDGPGAGPDLGPLSVAGFGGSAALLYELEDDDAVTPGDTVSLQLSLWTGSDWGSPTQVYDGSNGNIERGGARIAIDPTAPSLGDGLVLVYIDSTGINLVGDDGLPLSGSAAGFPGTVGPDMTVGIAAESGSVLVFYEDTIDGGQIAAFDRDGETWSAFTDPEFIAESDPTAFDLSAAGGRFYATYRGDGFAQLKVYR